MSTFSGWPSQSVQALNFSRIHAAWPDGDRRTRLVFIVRDIAKDAIEGLFRAFTDQIEGSGAAFTDKTLSLNR